MKKLPWLALAAMVPGLVAQRILPRAGAPEEQDYCFRGQSNMCGVFGCRGCRGLRNGVQTVPAILFTKRVSELAEIEKVCSCDVTIGGAASAGGVLVSSANS
jgi:hypothetical protein